MYNTNAELVSWEDILEARTWISGSEFIFRTPTLYDVEKTFDVGQELKSLHRKLENMQGTGEHK